MKTELSVKDFSQQLIQKIKDNKIHIVGHFDTDGITSTAILTKTFNRLKKQFSTKIIKQLNQEEINLFPRDRIIILLDLGSGSLEELSRLKNTIFIIDHHEIKENPKNIVILNPHINKDSIDLCSAELTYLVSKEISEDNKDLAQLAILGMIGDIMEKDINKIRDSIIKDADIKIKKGVLIYPSTRPLDKALEYSSRPFIPGVTGNRPGTFEILDEAGIQRIGKSYKALIDLTEQEMKSLATAIALRLSEKEITKHFGNLYLLKFFNKIEDAREVSAIINSCSRMDQPEIALLTCLGNNNARKKAEKIYVKYRQNIISGLRYIESNGNIHGKEYVIINTKNNIKDTLIGTLASILSFSSVYKEGTIIIAMAYNEDKIKVSARIAGKSPHSARNLKELMDSITQTLGHGESGGHKHAAGCTIKIEHEERFIDLIKRKLDVEVVKV